MSALLLVRRNKGQVKAEMIEDYTVADVVPHKDGMMLLDTILSCDDEELTAQVSIAKSTLFLNEEDYVPAWVGIEYMAQAVAAWAGVQGRNKGQGAKIGYLLGTRKYRSYCSVFPLGSVLTIHIKRHYQEGELGVFECRISADALLAEAALNVYQPE